MYGWCEKCNAVALEGLCSVHGKTKPLSTINSIELRPLTEFEKCFLNERNKKLKFGDGIFLVYGDRVYRRKVVLLDRPLLEFKLLKDGIHVNPFVEGHAEGMSIESLITTNKDRMSRLVSVTKTFAECELERGENTIISFSAGKDSVVLAHLLAEFRLRNVFIDTTIEFPETYRFIKKLRNEGWNLDITRAHQSFFALLKERGYPSYKNRWCCKTQKLYPFATYLKEQFGNEEVQVFSGERRWEALSRLDQPLRKKHKHIANQETVQILLDWLTMDIWIYTWANNLLVNQLYGYYARGGCWTCPFGLRYRIFLMKYAHPKLFKILERLGLTSRLIVKKKEPQQPLSPSVAKFLDTKGKLRKFLERKQAIQLPPCEKS